MNITDILSQASRGELSEEQVTGLSKALNQARPDLADTWAITLDILPRISRENILSPDQTAEMQTMLLKYATARMKGVIGTDTAMD